MIKLTCLEAQFGEASLLSKSMSTHQRLNIRERVVLVVASRRVEYPPSPSSMKPDAGG